MRRGLLLLAAGGLTLACSAGPGVVSAPPPVPAPSPAPTVAAPPVTPLPELAPPAEQLAPRALEMPSSDLEPPLVRVLLERSRAPLRLPQPGRAYTVFCNGELTALRGPLELRAVAEESLWQVGAWRDRNAAAAAMAKLAASLGDAVEVVASEASDSLVRVRVKLVSLETPRERLAALGFPDAYPVPGPSRLELEGVGGRVLRAASEMVLQPQEEWPTAAGGKEYRGRFRARAIDGQVLLVNELNLELYLKGVVPVEMGPYQFPELEALKAQAVAARTYAVAHLGDHEDEGWDLCDTPACQAYGGRGAEHSLSNRAVEETAGLIAVFEGQPIDAMYTSTCGGHTEDAALVFADRAQPYLKGVPCRWERGLALAGEGGSGRWLEAGEFAGRVVRRALALPVDAGVAEALRKVPVLTGGAVPDIALDSAEDLARAAISAAGLQGATELFASSESAVQRLLELADLVEVELPPPTAGWREGWGWRALAAVLEVQGVIERDRGEAVPHPEGVAIYPRRAERSEPLQSPLPLYEAWDGVHRALAGASVAPGTTLERIRAGERVLALSVVRSGGGGEADRRSAWRSWTRERSWTELASRLGMADLSALEIASRGASGRVAELVVRGADGRHKSFFGFEVRQVLDLPETYFSMHRLRRADGTEVVRFIGRGWGHGIGLCQNGAYGLARSGQRFEKILRTYYQGVEIIPWSPQAAAAP